MHQQYDPEPFVTQQLLGLGCDCRRPKRQVDKAGAGDHSLGVSLADAASAFIVIHAE